MGMGNNKVSFDTFFSVDFDSSSLKTFADMADDIAGNEAEQSATITDDKFAILDTIIAIKKGTSEMRKAFDSEVEKTRLSATKTAKQLVSNRAVTNVAEVLGMTEKEVLKYTKGNAHQPAKLYWRSYEFCLSSILEHTTATSKAKKQLDKTSVRTYLENPLARAFYSAHDMRGTIGGAYKVLFFDKCNNIRYEVAHVTANEVRELMLLDGKKFLLLTT